MNTKHLELAALKAAVTDNAFVFEASTVGNPDRSGDVIMPGAFSKAVMSKAVEEGWADVAHEWEGEPIGFFDSIRMEGDTLVMAGRFHTTGKAQEARTVMMERAEAGKKNSVSIGFRPDYSKCREFESGSALLEWAASEKMDTGALDAAAIKKLGWCRAITAVEEIFECSYCNVGMNKRAKVRTVKSFSGDEEAPAATLAESLESALAAVKRAVSVHEQRSEDGRTLSLAHVPTLQAIQAASADLLAAMEPKDDEPEPTTKRAAHQLRLAEAWLTLRNTNQ